MSSVETTAKPLNEIEPGEMSATCLSPPGKRRGWLSDPCVPEGKVHLVPMSPNLSSQENHGNREEMTHRHQLLIPSAQGWKRCPRCSRTPVTDSPRWEGRIRTAVEGEGTAT